MTRAKPDLGARKLIIVTGKGGVGKSTVAGALAVAASRRGLRTLVAEVAGLGDVPAMLGAEAVEPLVEQPLDTDLYHVVIERGPALEEYLRQELKWSLPARVLSRSKLFQLFIDAAPGMSDLLTIGKVWELAERRHQRRGRQPYDLVVLDGPASGQALGLLTAPQTFAAIAQVGPVARQATSIDRSLTDARKTSVVIVTTLEQMAVSEALSLAAALQGDLGMKMGLVAVNRMIAAGFSARDREVLAGPCDDPAVRSARWLDGRERAQHAHLSRLRQGVADVALTTLPFLFRDELDRGDIEHLADLLGRAL